MINESQDLFSTPNIWHLVSHFNYLEVFGTLSVHIPFHTSGLTGF